MIQRLVVIMKIIFRSLVRSDVISTKKLVILVNAIQVAIDNYENESRYDPAAQQVNGIDILKQFYLHPDVNRNKIHSSIYNFRNVLIGWASFCIASRQLSVFMASLQKSFQT